MTTCILRPMPEAYRKISKKFRPQRPPHLFTDIDPGGLTPADIQLAQELFKLLDEESKDWYGRRGIFEGL